MKLAEALIARADLQKKIAQIRERMEQNSKVQEGDKPAESVDELLLVFESTTEELTKLIKQINRTNADTVLGGGTLIDAIAERDCIKGKIAAYRSLYDSAAIKQGRYSRSEVKYIRQVDMAELQKNIDSLSKKHREIDTEIQAKNWTTELAE